MDGHFELNGAVVPRPAVLGSRAKSGSGSGAGAAGAEAIGRGFQLSDPQAVVPRRVLRNRVVESRLDGCVAVQPVTWVRAPSGVGKRTAVAVWVNHSTVEREVIWARAVSAVSRWSEAPAVSAVSGRGGVVEAIFRVVGRGNGDYRHTDSMSDALLTRSQLRVVAIEATRKKNRQTVVVVELGVGEVTRGEFDELVEFIVESFQLRVILIQDEDLHSAMSGDMPPPHVTAHDFQLATSDVEAEGARHGLRLTGPVVERLAGIYCGSPVFVAAFIEQVLEHPERDVDDSFARAHARVAIAAAQKLMGETGITILVMLALVPEVSESFLSGLAVGQHVDGCLRVLCDRGLLQTVKTSQGNAAYRLPGGVAEFVRSLTLSYYLAQRVALHTLVCDYLVSAGEIKLAVEQQLLVRDSSAALDLFCIHWAEYLRVHGLKRVRELAAVLPLAEVLVDLEASSALWLIYSTVPDSGIAKPCAPRIVRASKSELDLLSARGRLSVRTARILIFLESDRLDAAAMTVVEGIQDLAGTGADVSVRGSAIHLSFLLAAARTSLSNGVLRRSATLYEEALALAEIRHSSIGAYQALSGYALTLTFNGEFIAAQQIIDRALVLEKELDMCQSKTAVELLFCQCQVWINTDGLDNLHAATHRAEAYAQTSKEWSSLVIFLKACNLIQRGQLEATASILRNFLGSTSAKSNIPLFRPSIVWILAIILNASKQPGAALEAIKDQSQNHGHYPCFAVIRVLAQIGQGDPVAALETVKECLESSYDHAEVSMIYVYLARAVAFEVLSLQTSAEDSFVIAVGAAAQAGMQVKLEVLASREITSIAQRVAERYPDLNSQALDFGAASAAQGAGKNRRFIKLTTKEREVLSRLANKSTLAQIAAELFVSENTVKTHTKNLYRKLGVSSRRQAIDLVSNWQDVALVSDRIA